MPLSYTELSKMNNSLDNELTEVYSENWCQKDTILVLKEESRTQQVVIESLKLQLKQRGHH